MLFDFFLCVIPLLAMTLLVLATQKYGISLLDTIVKIIWLCQHISIVYQSPCNNHNSTQQSTNRVHNSRRTLQSLEHFIEMPQSRGASAKNFANFLPHPSICFAVLQHRRFTASTYVTNHITLYVWCLQIMQEIDLSLRKKIRIYIDDFS